MSWSSSVYLPVDDSKCCIMNIITKRHLTPNPVSLSVDSSLPEVEYLTFLGVIMSRDLKWNRHVDYITKRALKRFFILYNLRRVDCPPMLLRRCYISFIRSILTYSYACFCNIPQYLLKKPIAIEKRAYGIIGLPYVEELSLAVVCDKTCESLFSKIVKYQEHPLRELFSIRSCVRATRSSCILNPPPTKTERFRKSFIRFCK